MDYLESLEIHNFRGFRHLTIPRLGRVNLIVGRNGAGKTALLEALWLYATPISDVIGELLVRRDEDRLFIPGENREDWDDPPDARYLFLGRGDLSDRIEEITIGPIGDSEKRLTLCIEIPPAVYSTRRKGRASSTRNVRRPVIVIETGNQSGDPVLAGQNDYLTVTGLAYRINLKRGWLRPVRFISANDKYRAWNDRLSIDTAMADIRPYLLTMLRIIVPGVEDVHLVGYPYQSQPRISIVYLAGEKGPVSLRSLGDGLSHIFNLAIALVNAQNGFLLVDEIENGLHYSIQPQVWQVIFQIARRLNVQVFATTHSRECIEAFALAVQEDEQEEGMLVRLENKNGENRAVLFGERELAIATSEAIEVR